LSGRDLRANASRSSQGKTAHTVSDQAPGNDRSDDSACPVGRLRLKTAQYPNAFGLKFNGVKEPTLYYLSDRQYDSYREFETLKNSGVGFTLAFGLLICLGRHQLLVATKGDVTPPMRAGREMRAW
jgi:hypothetical protein